MSDTTFETIIIGAGIAGIGCAHTLKDAGKNDFLVLTEDIGGRIFTSDDGKVNYGAYFISDDYTYVLKHVKTTVRLRLRDLEFHDKEGRPYRAISSLRYPLQLIRMIKEILVFRKAFFTFRKECESMGQKQALEKNPYLRKLYYQKAEAFVREKRFEDLAQGFFAQVTFLFFFEPLANISAFDFMRTASGMVVKSYEFDSDEETLCKGFYDQVFRDSVTQIDQGKPHTVHTASGKSYTSKNVVVATPPEVAKELLHLPKVNKTSGAYVFHLKGKIKKEWSKGQYQLFPPGQDVVGFARQRDGSILFCSLNENPDLEEYIDEIELIEKKHWEKAFVTDCEVLFEGQQGPGLYFIGDRNLSGLEDSYISGIAAANQIIAQAKD